MGLKVKPNSDPKKPAGDVDWRQLKVDVLAKLDVVAEYRALGVEVTGTRPNGKGVIECKAFGRDDDNPSAMINVRTGVYHDSGGSASLNFWDFALQHGKVGGRHIDVVKHYAAKAGVEVPSFTVGKKGRIREAVYEYRDERGQVRYGVFRYRLPSGKKDFTQHARVGRDGWKLGTGAMDGVVPLPYRLPELLASDPEDPVWVVEGEQDVERLRSLGLVATTNHQGSKSTDKTWPHFLGFFSHRTCYVVPDNDATGLAHARRVAFLLHDVAATVKVVELPDLLPKGDVSDWLDDGHTIDDLGKLAHAAKVFHPLDLVATAEDDSAAVAEVRDATVADLRVLQTATTWLWPSWIPSACLTLLASEPGIGKTRTCMDLARRIYHGLPWPDGQANEHSPGGKTLWVAADNQYPELVEIPAAFGVPDEAVVLNAPADDPYGGTSLETPEELADLEARIRRVRPSLVIIDTITNSGDFKSQDSVDAKRQYKPLQEVALRTQTPILCVTHLNASGKVLGRRAIEKARVAMTLECPDPDNQWNRRKLWVSKSKAPKPRPLGVTMGDCGNEYDDVPPEAPVGAKERGQVPKASAKAIDFLRERLGRGSARVSVVRGEAEQQDISASTLYGAMRQIGVLETEDGRGKKWWALPAAAAANGNGANGHHNGDDVAF